MKKILFTILILTSTYVFSIEYNTYEMVEEHVFKASHWGIDDYKDLALNKNPGGSDALGPGLFFIDSQLVISDQVNDNMRTLFLGENYSLENIFESSFNKSNILISNNNIVGYNNSYISCYNITNGWDLTFLVSIYDLNFLKDYKDLYFQDNTLFIFDANNKLWAIKDPGLDNSINKKNIVKEDDIIKEINEGKYKGLTIDSDKRLFLNGGLQTINYSVFYSYYKEQNPNKEKLSNDFRVDNIIIQISPQASSQMTFLSKDKFNNYYYKLGHKYIAIFNNKGLLNEFFEFDYNKSDTYPAVSPEGDVYFMKYGSDKVTLYKIPRQW